MHQRRSPRAPSIGGLSRTSVAREVRAPAKAELCVPETVSHSTESVEVVSERCASESSAVGELRGHSKIRVQTFQHLRRTREIQNLKIDERQTRREQNRALLRSVNSAALLRTT